MSRDLRQSLVGKNGLSGMIEFLGWLEPDEMNALYLGSDVVVHPARQEPFGLLVLEGMAWGKPVIGSDAAGSVVDRIESGNNGLVFPAGDVHELLELIRFTLNSPDELERIGLNARKTAEEWPVERGVNIIVNEARKHSVK